MPDINAYSSTLSNNVVYLNKCKHGMGKLSVRVSKVGRGRTEGQGNPVLNVTRAVNVLLMINNKYFVL